MNYLKLFRPFKAFNFLNGSKPKQTKIVQLFERPERQIMTQEIDNQAINSRSIF
jgi:hypothetical protein